VAVAAPPIANKLVSGALTACLLALIAVNCALACTTQAAPKCCSRQKGSSPCHKPAAPEPCRVDLKAAEPAPSAHADTAPAWVAAPSSVIPVPVPAYDLFSVAAPGHTESAAAVSPPAVLRI
jgi:hypothetical protein